MAKAALLFDGIKYSFALVDRAISWALQDKGELIAVFLIAEKEPSEGYIFPSDLDAAENLSTDDDSHSMHLKIVESNMHILEHNAAASHIKLETKKLVNPKQHELSELLHGCERIFTSTDIGDAGILTVDSINIDKFLGRLSIPVEVLPK